MHERALGPCALEDAGLRCGKGNVCVNLRPMRMAHDGVYFAPLSLENMSHGSGVGGAVMEEWLRGGR